MHYCPPTPIQACPVFYQPPEFKWLSFRLPTHTASTAIYPHSELMHKAPSKGYLLIIYPSRFASTNNPLFVGQISARYTAPTYRMNHLQQSEPDSTHYMPTDSPVGSGSQLLEKRGYLQNCHQVFKSCYIDLAHKCVTDTLPSD